MTGADDDSPAIERLVIRAPNWLGDAIMALPAMGAVRRAYKDAHLAVAAVPSIAPLFDERHQRGSRQHRPTDRTEERGDRTGGGEVRRRPADAEFVPLRVGGATRLDSRAVGVPERHPPCAR